MRVLVALAVIIALTVPAAAQACVPGEARPEWCIYSNIPAPLPCIRDLHEVVTHYIDHDPCDGSSCFFAIWMYQEWNGVEWMQRDDPMMDNTCGGEIPADFLIF